MTDRILEIGEAGLESADQKVRKLMDNMVNAQVPGYKKSDAIVRSFPLELEAATKKISAMKPRVEGAYTDTTTGSLVKTGGKLDVALADDGYFVVVGQWGEGYTRDGRFRLDKDGSLLSVAGNFPVMGTHGPITVSTGGGEVEITQDGDVKVAGEVVDRLFVVKPENKTSLESLNGSLFKLTDVNSALIEISNPRVIQGYIESSNVNIVDQMMEMIYLERTYNLNTRVVRMRDESLAKAMELGRPTQ